MSDDVQINGYWLEERSDEFQDVKDYVTICLKSISTSSMEIWKIESSSTKAFERTYADSLRLQCWYDVRRKAANGPAAEFGIHEICTQGFVSPNNNGVEFFTGTIPKSMQEDYPSMNILVLTDVAVGKSFVIDSNPDKTTIPDGFDSFYLLNSPLDANNDGEFSLQEYQAALNFDSRTAADYFHKFYIKDHRRANPKYVVRFIIDQSKREHGSINAPISQYDESILSSKDLLIDSATFVPIISNNKSNLSRVSTRYLNIDDAVNKAVNEFKDGKESESIAKHKKDWINSQLDILDEKVRNLNLNYAEINEAVNDCSEGATKELQASTRRKLELVLSMEVELRRQLEQYAWYDNALNKHISNLNSTFKDPSNSDKSNTVKKMEFIRAWRNYSRRREQSNNTKLTDVKVLQSIQPDTKLNGDLHISSHADIGGMSNAATLGSNVDAFANESKRTYNLQSYLNSNFGRNVSAVKGVANKEFPSSVHSILLTQYDKIQESLEGSINGSSLAHPIYLNGGSGLGELPTGVFTSNLVQLTGPTVTVKADEVLPDPADAFKETIVKIVKGSLFSNDTFYEDSVVEDESDSASIANSESESQSHSYAETQSQSSEQDLRDKLRSRSKVAKASGFEDSFPSPQHSSSGVPDKSKLIQRYKFDPSTTFNSPWYKQFSLSDAAERKLKIFRTKKLADPPVDNLNKSNIINPQEANVLMLNLPFFTLAPTFKLVYDFKTTKQDHPALTDLYSRAASGKGPVLLLIQSGDLVFGAYLSHPALMTNSWSGNASSFLFSVTWNMKLPFHGRNSHPDSKGSFTFHADRDCLEIGNGDLRLSSTLKSGSSELENCFGFASAATSTTKLNDLSRYIMTGTNEFSIDRLELWNVMNAR